MHYDSFFQWLFRSIFESGDDPLITLTAYILVMYAVCRLSWDGFCAWLDIFAGLGRFFYSRFCSIFERWRGRK